MTLTHPVPCGFTYFYFQSHWSWRRCRSRTNAGPEADEQQKLFLNCWSTKKPAPKQLVLNVKIYRPRHHYKNTICPCPAIPSMPLRLLPLNCAQITGTHCPPIPADNGRVHSMARQSVALSPRREYVTDCMWAVPLAEERQHPRRANRHGDNQIFLSFSLTLV